MVGGRQNGCLSISFQISEKEKQVTVERTININHTINNEDAPAELQLTIKRKDVTGSAIYD